MSELWGVVAAAASSALGGTSIAATGYLVGHLDPLAIGSFRFGIGCLSLARSPCSATGAGLNAATGSRPPGSGCCSSRSSRSCSTPR